MTIIVMINALIMSIGIASILSIIRFKKIEKKKLIYISFGLFVMFNNQSVSVMYFNQLLAVVLIGIFEYLDNGNFYRGMITGGVALIICRISSSFIGPFIDMESIFNNTLGETILTLLTIMLAIVISFFVKRLYIMLKEYSLNNISWKVISIMLILIVGGLSVYIAVIPKGQIINKDGDIINYYNGSTFTIYLLILMGLIYVLGNKFKEEIIYKQKLKETENLKEYTSSLENMYEDLRKFRHDYINIISSIVGYIDDNDMNGLKNHVYTNIIPLEQIMNKNNTRLHLLKNIRVSELKGTVSSKLIRAQELNINVTIDIMEEIENIDEDIVKTCRIIGILLDNAIEECETIEGSYLNFGIIKHKTSIDFIIENSCRETIEPIYILNSKGFSTKGKNRGLGLHILEELVQESEKIFLDTIVENKKFTQVLTLMR